MVHHLALLSKNMRRRMIDDLAFCRALHAGNPVKFKKPLGVKYTSDQEGHILSYYIYFDARELQQAKQLQRQTYYEQFAHLQRTLDLFFSVFG